MVIVTINMILESIVAFLNNYYLKLNLCFILQALQFINLMNFFLIIKIIVTIYYFLQYYFSLSKFSNLLFCFLPHFFFLIGFLL